MLRKNLELSILIATVIVGGTATLVNTPYAHAATINCAGVVGTCSGTNGDDAMAGDAGSNLICGRQGNDRIMSSAGNDRAGGDDGNDVIDGGLGDDTIAGGTIAFTMGCGSGAGGADNLNGGPDNDKIFHSSFDRTSVTDGARDFISCGPGNDEAWINTSIDGDIAVGCEIVHAG